ncbi:hypothetical protein M5D96_003450 [Drosophila gunungcola]|uniref:Uncharacterized protein n=1 Tax=Drosophila gunungcola TaxID=103775 RepID=A0A9P9YSL9_9MUSC|nr:hypothetical protein M5D96_003450 [Drosophila gunungcola]
MKGVEVLIHESHEIPNDATPRLFTDHDEIIKGKQKNCDCLPPCEFNRYEFQGDIRLLNRMIYNNMTNPSIPKPTNEVRLRVYYDSPIAEEQVLDVFGNWLTFMGKSTNDLQGIH